MKKLLILPLIATLGLASENISQEEQLNNISKKIENLAKKLKKTDKKLAKVKAHDGYDNIKWSVDIRTAVDNLKYKHIDGSTSKNSALFTNRLLLSGAYAPTENDSFRMSLSYMKNYGDSANHSQTNSIYGKGFADFDWVANENSLDGKLRVKEAYWLYVADEFMGKDIHWTASFGRRPSTDGLFVNMREDIKAKSPLAHAVNINFDGASFRFNTDKIAPWDILKTGSWFKLCFGRELTNAVGRFDFFAQGADYSRDLDKHSSIDMKGFIFVPYDDGQYSIHTSFATVNNLIGFTNDDMAKFNFASQGYDPESLSIGNDGAPAIMSNDFYNAYLAHYMGKKTDAEFATDLTNIQTKMNTTYKQLDGTSAKPTDFKNSDFSISNISDETKAKIKEAQMAYVPTFKNFGGYSYTSIVIKANGLGDEVSDFMDNTNAFLSFTTSTTSPNSGMNMLGSSSSVSGSSIWFGLNMPSSLTQNAKWGVEYNKGSKYWRGLGYGEDTMGASKLQARGEALEVYYNQKLTTGLNASLRMTKIMYDYTGSQSFFGEDGTPYTMTEAKNRGMNPVSSVRDIRFEISYRY
jgi:hypothetical protein